jgi:small subunit ribosomal protein S3
VGHKVHPYGFRIGVIRGWHAKWYDEKHYAEFLYEDLKVRRAIEKKCSDGGVARVEIDHQGNEILLTVYSSRPGIVIGRGGQRAEELRSLLEEICGKRVRLSIKEVEQPELEACLVARNVADQIERRMAFRRSMKQAAFRTMQAGAKGVKISCAGRLGGVEIARRETTLQGQLPLHTLCADIDYGFAEAHTTLGHIGVKVWIYKGDILPEVKRESVTAEASEVS